MGGHLQRQRQLQHADTAHAAGLPARSTRSRVSTRAASAAGTSKPKRPTRQDPPKPARRAVGTNNSGSAAGVLVFAERRSDRRRKRSLTPAGGEEEDDEEKEKEDEEEDEDGEEDEHDNDNDSNDINDNPTHRRRSPSRSRSLSVIPTVHMPPITLPSPNDAAVRALGLAQSARPGTEVLTLSREDVVRMREGHLPPRCPIRHTAEPRDWKKLNLSEAAWARLEECGGATKGRSWTTREGCDVDGEPVKPDFPYVMLTKLVIASSPRKMLTLNQIYHAMEERWPYFRSVGQTFRNSIRHSLSMNSAFVNVERPLSEGGMGTGKGGYWRVSEDTTTSHRGRSKKPRIETAHNTYPPTKPQGAHVRYAQASNQFPTPHNLPQPLQMSQPYHSPVSYSCSTPPGGERALSPYQSFTRHNASGQEPLSPHSELDLCQSRPNKTQLSSRHEPLFDRRHVYTSVPSPRPLLPTPPYETDCGPLMQLANIALPESPKPAIHAAPDGPTVYSLPPLRAPRGLQRAFGPQGPPHPGLQPHPLPQPTPKLPSFAHLLNPALSD